VTVSELSCRFEAADGCAIVTLLPALNNSPWSEIEQTGNHLLEQVRSTSARIVIVDLSPLNYMSSALVALIVRIWKVVKEREGRFVVVNREPLVYEVLKIAGLHNLWTIVETREEALDAAGVSPQAITRKRETRLLTIVGPLAVIAAGVGLALLIVKTDVVPSLVALGLALGWAALGVLVGVVTFARSSGGARTLAGLVVAACVAIAAATVFFWPDDLNGAAQPGDPAPSPPASVEGRTPGQPGAADSPDVNVAGGADEPGEPPGAPRGAAPAGE
jgi:anti-anti-sigma factor